VMRDKSSVIQSHFLGLQRHKTHLLVVITFEEIVSFQ
jgi:hypothetical protein